jgi:DNA-binding MarR family transcriptional regulator
MADLFDTCRAFVASEHYVDLSARQFALLGIVCDEPGPHHVRVLAQALNVQRPVVTRAVDKLKRFGFVKRVYGTFDKRDVMIEPTAEGKAFRIMLGIGLPKN